MSKRQDSAAPEARARVSAGITDVPAGTLSEPEQVDGTSAEGQRGGMTTVAVLAVAVGAYGAMETMIVPVMPIIQDKLGATGPQISWMLTGLLLVGAVSLPLLSRLAEIYDKRVVILGVLSVACAGAVMAALAPSVGVLTAGQLLQGVGLASIPVAIGVLRDTLPPERVHAANGLLLASGSIAAGAGLLLVGPITDYLDYTFVFWIPSAIIVTTIILVFVVVPACPPRVQGSADWVGAAILGGGLGAVLIGLTLSSSNDWLSWKVLGLIVLGLLAIVGFVLWEPHVESPLVDTKAMTDRDVLLVLGTAVGAGFGQFSMYVVLPVLATLSVASGYGMGGGAYTASLVIFTFVAAAAIGALGVTPLSGLLGWRTVMVLSGALFIAASSLLLLIGSVHWIPFVVAALTGLGAGGGQAQQLNILVDRVAPDRAATIAGSLWVLRSVGGTFGSQITAAILAAHLLAGSVVSSWAGYVVCIAVVALSGVLIIVLSAFMRSTDAAVRN